MSEKIVVLVTAGDVKNAEKIARTLVDERLAACVNLVPKIRSFYRWEGEVQDDEELLLIIKTMEESFEDLKKRILPFTLYNHQVGDDFVLLSDNGGINFYLGNNPLSRGSFHVTDPRWGDIESQHQMARSIAEDQTGRSLKPSEVSSYWMNRGFDYMLEEPVHYLGLLLRKLKCFLENFEYAIIYAPASERDLTPSLYLLFLPFAAIISAAAMGIAAIVFRGRVIDEKKNKTQSRARWIPVLMVLVTNLVSVLAFFNYSRFRLCVVPALILLGVCGFERWISFLRRKQMMSLAIATTAGVLVLPASLIPYGDQWQLQEAHGHRTIGLALKERGDLKAAEERFSRALEIRPDLDLVLAQRGLVRTRLKDYARAKQDLDKALRLNSGVYSHLTALAIFYANESPYRDLDLALDRVREAAARPIYRPAQQAEVFFSEGVVRMERKEFLLAAEAYEKAYSINRDDLSALFCAGLAYKNGQEMDKAGDLFYRVLQLDPDHAGARMELASIQR